MLNGMPKLKEILFYLFYACLYAGMLKKILKYLFSLVKIIPLYLLHGPTKK
jgi:hypothetical protein